jgi:transcriptional regulator with XRE-family HTH domain
MARIYPLDPDYAVWLRTERTRRDMSQLQLALKLGCAEGTIGKYERLSAQVPPALRSRIAAVFSAADQAPARVPA